MYKHDCLYFLDGVAYSGVVCLTKQYNLREIDGLFNPNKEEVVSLDIDIEGKWQTVEDIKAENIELAGEVISFPDEPYDPHY